MRLGAEFQPLTPYARPIDSGRGASRPDGEEGASPSAAAKAVQRQTVPAAVRASDLEQRRERTQGDFQREAPKSAGAERPRYIPKGQLVDILA